MPVKVLTVISKQIEVNSLGPFLLQYIFHNYKVCNKVDIYIFIFILLHTYIKRKKADKKQTELS